MKGYTRSFKKSVNPQINRQEFIEMLRNDLTIKAGDVVFIHSSMRNLYLSFDKQEILNILLEVVTNEGTLLFPCWHFNIRAEDYIREHEVVFDFNNSSSAMGKISDVLRKSPQASRSFHPTNSVIAIGKHAKELTADHEEDIYPCGVKSPWHKMMKYNAKVVGLGVTVDNLTFVHAIEDFIKNEFPIKTRMQNVFSCKCIDQNGNIKMVETLVASTSINPRNVVGFFNKHISKKAYRQVKLKKMDFFSLDAVPIFEEIKNLALADKTIYRY
ncbi:MAG: AAC(3) family N-acetyltransferase [Bacteroidia bacterium]|nr:AAC(3) family N-acetyltransferase [Bacteroidia bacterium]